MANGAPPSPGLRIGAGGSSDAAGGAGIYGFNPTAGGFGVWGQSSDGIGVRGTTGSATGFGAIGISSSDATGVKGISNASDLTADGDGGGIGVHGKSGSGHGVKGESGGGNGLWGSASFGTGAMGESISGAGVLGRSDTGFGVKAEGNSAAGIALKATHMSNGTAIRAISNTSPFASDGSGSGIAVHGQSGSGNGVRGESTTGIGVQGVSGTNQTGVKGVSNTGGSFGADGNGTGIGVHGKSTGGNGVKGESVSAAGVHGSSTSQPGVDGVSVNSLGVRGTSTNFVGVVGISTNNHGLYGYSASAAGTALVGDNGGGGLAGIFNGRVEVYGSFQVFGVKNAVLKMPDGTNALVYCQESPEPYFEDFGRAQLVGGVAHVPIERDFNALVAGGDYMVFPVAEGDTRGLFVSRRGPAGFEVREMQAVPATYPSPTASSPGARMSRASASPGSAATGKRRWQRREPAWAWAEGQRATYRAPATRQPYR